MQGRVCGRGGMGVVYKAREVGLNRTVALKMIHAETCANPVARVRFLREAQLLASLRHPNIVQLHAVLEHEDRLCFVMECIDGVNLARRLGKGLPPARQAAQWLEAAARAIHYAHQKGVAHRDLKPGNILLDRDGTPKIIDFGLARRLEQATAGTVVDHPTRSGEILGTPNYMAPEQADGRTKEAGPSADVYALGAILYECLTGHPPFEGTTPLEMLHRIIYEEPAPPTRLQPKVPRDLETICLTCLRKEPQRRYATAEALANELRGFLAGEPIAARPAGPWERLRRWMRRRPAVAVTVGVGSVAVAGMLVGALWLSSLAVAGVAVFAALLGAAWYGARLRAALRELERQQVRAERNVERLHLLLETTRRLMSAPHLDELLRLLGEITTRLANAERATIYLVDPLRRELWSKVALGDEVGEIRVPLGKGIAGTVALNAETINLEDPYTDPRFNAEVDRRTGYTTRNLLTLPMTGRDGRVLGVFQVLNKRSGPFAADDVEILHSLAASAALAVENAQQ
ncbi:MAG TPA: protein kinase [Gemmataceae bacterium]|nr:protein kinase [Gemmataceae bacterium]